MRTAKFGVIGIAQLTLPNTRQVLPPSVMMLVKGRGIDRCNKIWRESVLETKEMQAAAALQQRG